MDLLRTNCFDTNETMIILGSCVKNMHKNAYNEILKISENIYEVCLEETHLNMVVTKIIAMAARGNIKNLYFISVDKSPHCIQLHYIVKEMENAMDISKMNIKSYIVANDNIEEIPLEVISLSKNLLKLKNKINNIK